MYKGFLKRGLDVAFALLLLPVVVLCCGVLGLLIRLEDGGDVFYSARRLGKNGRVFRMLKLRSMRLNAPDIRNADGSTYNAEDDWRMTRLGGWLRRTSLDELPQVFNVLWGDMSFVGPRPDLPDHLSCYSGAELRKLEVLPGITGYSQAFFRNSIPWKERLRHDVFYVDQLSLKLDMTILVRTVITVLGRQGINPEGISHERRG